ncbi:MAG TPA: DUF4388 domain-containing protein [Polyangiaceae bacterium]|nr:DUF4388 domain-containing protein [Polyangiaceae bacterium]
MSRVVLLIEPDVDVLGALASKLRGRGLEVAIADSLTSAAERARSARPEVLLVAQELSAGHLDAELSAFASLSLVPRFLLVSRDSDLAPNELPRDPEQIAKRVYALPSKAAPVVAEGGDFRGDLQQVSVIDLLQLLSMNRRSGTLSVTTPVGAGELRLTDGEIIDAVYRRVDGEKALFRLLTERDGSFAFVSGTQSALRRIEQPTNVLLMEGLRQLDEARRLRELLAIEDQNLLAITPPDPEGPEVEQRVLMTLVSPRTLAQLLDEIAAPDLQILIALEELLKRGTVRTLAAGAERVELADPERMSVLAALAKRVARAGFEGAARIGVAGSQQRLATMLSALGNLVDASVAGDVPAAPVPHRMAKIRLGDGIDLELVGLPLVEAYAPLWSLVLPSLIAVARVDVGATELLESAASLTGVPVIDAITLLGGNGDGDAQLVAGLIRMALESAAGA